MDARSQLAAYLSRGDTHRAVSPDAYSDVGSDDTEAVLMQSPYACTSPAALARLAAPQPQFISKPRLWEDPTALNQRHAQPWPRLETDIVPSSPRLLLAAPPSQHNDLSISATAATRPAPELDHTLRALQHCRGLLASLKREATAGSGQAEARGPQRDEPTLPTGQRSKRTWAAVGGTSSRASLANALLSQRPRVELDALSPAVASSAARAAHQAYVAQAALPLAPHTGPRTFADAAQQASPPRRIRPANMAATSTPRRAASLSQGVYPVEWQ
jgi:hypothetical protein